jgi:hypothetical protein
MSERLEIDPLRIPQLEYERDFLFHVNNVLHTRINLLLVVESIFFAALAACRRGQSDSGLYG